MPESPATFQKAAWRTFCAQNIRQLLMEHEEQLTLVEPVMNVELVVPLDVLGLVTGDLLKARRAQALDVVVGSTEDVRIVTAVAPLRLLSDYANVVRSATKGVVDLSLTLGGYSAVPKPDIPKILND